MTDLEKLLGQFIAYLQQLGRSESTLVAYRKDISQLLEYCTLQKKDFKISDFDSQILQMYVDSLKSSGEYTLKTISRKINSLKTLFKYLYSEKLVVEDYSKPVKHPELQAHTPRVLSSLEYRSLRDVARSNLRLYTMVELLLQTGIRIGELSRLKRNDVHLEANPPYIVVEQYSSNQPRNVELNATILESLKDYLHKYSPTKNDKGYLFSTSSGNMVLIRNIRTTVNRAFEKAGIANATVNDIRNTFIVYQLESGIDIELLSHIVGHQKPNTTERYMQIVQNRPRRIVKQIKPL